MHVCQGSNPGDLGGMSRAAVQKIWPQTELSFKLPHVNILVIQVVNFRAVSEIILEGVHFFQTPPPPGHTWSQSPPTLRTPLPHYGSNTP